MLAAEAAKLGLDEHERNLYFRTDRDKGNYVRPEARNARWHKFESVVIGNEDDVGVITRWTYPEGDALDQSKAAQHDNQVFLILLDRFTAEGRHVNHVSGPNFAPSVFAKEPEAVISGVTKNRFAVAMRRLFNAKKIRVEEYSRGGHRGTAKRIVRVTE